MHNFQGGLLQPAELHVNALCNTRTELLSLSARGADRHKHFSTIAAAEMREDAAGGEGGVDDNPPRRKSCNNDDNAGPADGQH